MLNKEKLCNESLETRLDKFSNGLDKFSNGLERLETRLEPRSSKFSRIEDRESSFDLHLSGTVHAQSIINYAYI